MARRRFRIPGAQYLVDCFGKRDPLSTEDVECACPKACHEACSRTFFDPKNSPRIERGNPGNRQFTPMPNGLFSRWPAGRELHPSVRLTYLYLVSKILPGNRLIVELRYELARDAPVSEKVFSRHIRMLRRRGFLQTRTRQEMGIDRQNGHVLVLRDLPGWMPTPTFGAEPAEPGSDRAARLAGDDVDDESCEDVGEEDGEDAEWDDVEEDGEDAEWDDVEEDYEDAECVEEDYEDAGAPEDDESGSVDHHPRRIKRRKFIAPGKYAPDVR